MHPLTIPDNAEEAFRHVADYLDSARCDRERVVKENGELIGYWQTPEWFDGLKELAKECRRVRGILGDPNGVAAAESKA